MAKAKTTSAAKAPESAPAATNETPDTEIDASSTAVIYDGPAPTMVNGMPVGGGAKPKVKTLEQRIAEAFPRADQIAVVTEIATGKPAPSAEAGGSEDLAAKVDALETRLTAQDLVIAELIARLEKVESSVAIAT